MAKLLQDSFGREIRDLRISLTDRCNFRCFYCRPNGEPPIANKKTILTFEEILKISELFVSLGIEKIRLTGGEPLLRRDIAELVQKLSSLKPQLKDLAITTNGFKLSSVANRLKRAGLDRVTVSIDSLKPKTFADMTGGGDLKSVIAGVKSANLAGLTPVKINVVLIKGYNDDEIVEFAEFARSNDVAVRFIEFMPLDSERNWKRASLVSGKEVFEKINRVFPLLPKIRSSAGETASKFSFADGARGEIGIIASVTRSFCDSCSRIRLTSDGKLHTCLFSSNEYNLREVVRSGAKNKEITDFIRHVIRQKEKGHQINESEFKYPIRSMSLIGG